MQKRLNNLQWGLKGHDLSQVCSKRRDQSIACEGKNYCERVTPESEMRLRSTVVEGKPKVK